MKAAAGARILNIRHLVVHPGPGIEYRTLSGNEIEIRRNIAIQSLHEIGNICEANNIRFTIENILAHLLFGETGNTFMIFGSLKNRYPAVCLDTGHAYLSDSLMDLIYKLSHQLRMVHLSDNKGKHDDHLPPGRGHIQWPHVLYALHQVNFNGTMILELAENSNNDTQAVLEKAKQGRRYLRDLMRIISNAVDRQPRIPMDIESLTL